MTIHNKEAYINKQTKIIKSKCINFSSLKIFFLIFYKLPIELVFEVYNPFILLHHCNLRTLSRLNFKDS